MIEMIHQIHKAYRTAIDALSEQMEALTQEVRTLKHVTPQPDTRTPIPFTLPATASARPSAHDTHPLTLLQAAPPQSWATVARKGRKEKATITARAAHSRQNRIPTTGLNLGRVSLPESTALSSNEKGSHSPPVHWT